MTINGTAVTNLNLGAFPEAMNVLSGIYISYEIASTYVVKLNKGSIKDIAGNQMEEDFVLTFTTK